MSNYLEHLAVGRRRDRAAARRRTSLLTPGGRVIVLQPNIRLVGPRYWDFIDHRVALTERSLVEAAELAGFSTADSSRGSSRIRPKGGCRAAPRLVRAYLAFRPAWRVMGQPDPVRR